MTSVQKSAQQEYGTPNPNAPRELSEFAFLIGNWRCDIKVKGEDNVYETHRATLVCRYILDGYVIADEYRQIGPAGELVRFGATYRSYNTEKNTWVMKWHDALTATWLDLGPEELGGVQVDNGCITFQHHLPPDGLIRVTFSNISKDHFTWRADRSTDGGEVWDEVMVMEVSRIDAAQHV